MEEIIQRITVFAIPLVLAITLHEAAHAYAAKMLGDKTAFMLGRVTLNPIKHIDPIWTIAIPLLLVVMQSPFVFGGAKPVPVNESAMRNPRRDMMIVAAAGPFANLVMMIAWAIFAKVASTLGGSGPAEFMVNVGMAGVLTNAVLMIFNLFPLLPLDGGRILKGLLPGNLALAYSRMEPYGMFILIALLASRVLDAYMHPLLKISVKAVYSAVGLI
jgi:Zn-dependent protease